MYFVHKGQTKFSDPQLFEAPSSELMPQRRFSVLKEKEGFYFFTLYRNSEYCTIIIIIIILL